MIVQIFHKCDFDGRIGEHLCWHEAGKLGALRQGSQDDDSRAHDYHRVFDNTYNQVAINYTSTGEFSKKNTGPDSHEFHLVDGGRSFVQAIYPLKVMDLTQWDGPKEGVVKDGCFQDVDIKTGDPFFTWCFLDHLPLQTHIYVRSKTQTRFTTTLGGDGSWFFAWDFFHINSVDKNDEGDYLISGRHADEIIKVAGPNSRNADPGAVIWRLGGEANQFKYENDLKFSRQHHARYVATTSDATVFTLFDNAWEGDAKLPDEPSSSGKLIVINNQTMTARLVKEYKHPEGKLCRSGGSMQMLSNGNVFIGWGFIRQVTEYHLNGTVLFHAHLKNGDGVGANNYQNFKYEWVANPQTPPTLLAYTRSCDRGYDSSPLMAYVSWNGATEVHRWRFYTAEYRTGPWMRAGTFRKTGFESKAEILDSFRPFVMVQGLDQNDNVLGSSIEETFVPGELAAPHCDDDGCSMEGFSKYERANSNAEFCPRDHSGNWVSLGLLFICGELLSFIWSALVCGNGGTKRQRRKQKQPPGLMKDWKVGG